MTPKNASSAENRISKVWTIVVAAGESKRFGEDKQKLKIGNKTVLESSVSSAASVGSVVIVAQAGRVKEIEQFFSTTQSVKSVVPGGQTRTASVFSGLSQVPSEVEIVLVHDGARPLATKELFKSVVEEIENGSKAVVPVVEVNDSLRNIAGNALDRSEVVAVQTPQGFNASVLRTAYLNEEEFTDDASKVENQGVKVEIIKGDPNNLKITHPIDLLVARQIANEVEDID